MLCNLYPYLASVRCADGGLAIGAGEADAEDLTPAEMRACQAAVRPPGLQAHQIDGEVLQSLYRKGLVYIDVPIAASDHVLIPPLEARARRLEPAYRLLTIFLWKPVQQTALCRASQGFVSNKDAAQLADSDPVERLLYSALVAATSRSNVGHLAAVLSEDVERLCQVSTCRIAATMLSCSGAVLHRYLTAPSDNVMLRRHVKMQGCHVPQAPAVTT